MIFNAPNESFKSIPNQGGRLHASHADFSLLGIKPNIAKVS